MTEKGIRDKFIAVVSKQWHVATWLYKVTVLPTDTDCGHIEAISENGGMITADYVLLGGIIGLKNWQMQ